MNKNKSEKRTKETKKKNTLTEKRVREIVKEEIIKWRKETFVPRPKY